MTEFKKLLKDSMIRALYTFAEVMLGFLTIGAAVSEIDWKRALSVSFVATLYALFKCLVVGLPESRVDGAIVINEGDDKDMWRFEAYDTLENLAKLAYGRFEIKNENSIKED